MSPIIEGVGQSDMTPIKLEQLRMILAAHLDISGNVIRKMTNWRRYYLYIDATSGPGRYTEHIGSPLVFLEEAQSRRLRYKALFIEEGKESSQELAQNVAGYPDVFVQDGDYESVIPDVFTTNDEKQIGLLYIDPNNGMPNRAAIQHVAGVFPRLDILLYASATAFKRVKGSPRLCDLIEGAGKRHWLIRKPFINDAWQWTFLLGSNMSFAGKMKRDLGMEPVNSASGQRIIDQLSLTVDERERLFQLPLTDLDQGYKTYAEYLQHPRFLAVRRKAMNRAVGRCEQCRDRFPTEVHHKRYPPWGTFDVPENLIALCHDCHCAIHGVEN